MNPAETHIDTEGIDCSVEDAVDLRLRQEFPGNGPIAEFCRSLQRSILDTVVELAEQTPEVAE